MVAMSADFTYKSCYELIDKAEERYLSMWKSLLVPDKNKISHFESVKLSKPQMQLQILRKKKGVMTTSRSLDTSVLSTTSTASPSHSQVNLLLLPFKILCRIFSDLPLETWVTVAQVCRRAHHLVDHMFMFKRQLMLCSDISSLKPHLPVRLCMSEDNLWPQRLYKCDDCLDMSMVVASYGHVDYLLKKCTRLTAVSFADPHRTVRPVGRSLFRLFNTYHFNQLNYLDLSYTSFCLRDLLDGSDCFPMLRVLSAQYCVIYISRRRTLVAENDRTLKNVLYDYTKRRHSLTQGIKVFLVDISEKFEFVDTVNVGGTQFMSTGCIVYCYGTEEHGNVYHLHSSNLCKTSVSSLCIHDL